MYHKGDDALSIQVEVWGPYACSVSYTHLDVYKRQEVYVLLRAQIGSRPYVCM